MSQKLSDKSLRPQEAIVAPLVDRVYRTLRAHGFIQDAQFDNERTPTMTSLTNETVFCQQCGHRLPCQQATRHQYVTACWKHDLAAAHLHIAVLDETILDLTAQVSELHEYIELRMGGMKPQH